MKIIKRVLLAWGIAALVCFVLGVLALPLVLAYVFLPGSWGLAVAFPWLIMLFTTLVALTWERDAW